MTWEEKYGAERARQMKEKLRKNRFPAHTVYPTPFARKYKLQSLEFRDGKALEDWEKLTRKLAYIQKAGTMKYERQRSRARRVSGKQAQIPRFSNPLVSPEDQ